MCFNKHDNLGNDKAMGSQSSSRVTRIYVITLTKFSYHYVIMHGRYGPLKCALMPISKECHL